MTSQSSPDIVERLRQFAAYGETGEGRILAQLALSEIERLRRSSAEIGYAAARENLREAWAALAMIREAIETLAPIGSVKAAEHLDGPTFSHEAEALVAGICSLGAAQTAPDPLLPCDVALPNNLFIRKGCKLSTLLHALERRGMAVSSTDREPPDYGYCLCGRHRDDQCDYCVSLSSPDRGGK